MQFRCLFHLHTRYSFDSLLPPRKIVARARELKVDALIVTDHNTIKGSMETRRVSQGNPPLVILAAEYQSEKGDIIGLFLEEEILSRDSNVIVRQIHEQGGLVVLPHPSKGHKLDDLLLSSVDIIETHNSRCSPEENGRARQLAQDWKLPEIAGADAHCLQELDTALNEYSGTHAGNEVELRALLLNGPRKVTTKRASPAYRPYSQLIKAVKTKNPHLFLYQAKRLVLTLARGQGNRP
jgi:predicted metal-dependent phosphoesterase TrpH